MPQPNFRVIDNEREHAGDLARKAVKKFRLHREVWKLPVVNVRDSFSPTLDVDEVLRRAEPKHFGKKT